MKPLNEIKLWMALEIAYRVQRFVLGPPEIFVASEDFDALLRALDVALRQRNDSLMMCFGESDLNDKYLIEYDAEILAAYEGSTDDKR